MRALAHPRLRRPFRLLWAIGLAATAASCSIPPDPYLGTVDSSGWDVRFAGGSPPPCVAPLVGLRGTMGAGAAANWFHLGNLSLNQLDLLNTMNPARPLPIELYLISGCAPYDNSGFNYRLNNFEVDKQYPVFAQNAVEPTSASTYSPFYFVTPVNVRSNQVGCNDVRSERTLLDRGGWDRSAKVFTSAAASAPLDVQRPAPAAVQAGMAAIKDFPLFNIAAPLMKTPNRMTSCPSQSGSTAKPPMKIGNDPNADFGFANLGWLRGLLGSYMDAGDVPLKTNPGDCLSLFETGATCAQDSDCTTASTACNQGRCVAANVTIDTGVSCQASKTACGGGSTCSAASQRCVAAASLTDTGIDCTATPCDASKGQLCINAGGAHTCHTAPLSICPAVTDLYVSDVEAYSLSAGTLTITSGAQSRVAQPITVFTAARGDAGFSPVCRVRRFDSAALAAAITAKTVICPQEMSAGQVASPSPRPQCTADQLQAAKVIKAETELSFVNCVFPSM